MPTEIEQIEDLIISEIKRTSERTANGIICPVIGIQNADTFGSDDIEEMLRTINTLTAARVIYGGGKRGASKVIGGGVAYDEDLSFRVVIVVTNLRSAKDGSRSGYAYVDAAIKCFMRFPLTPLRGYLWCPEDNLLLTKYGKWVYGLELERSINK